MNLRDTKSKLAKIVGVVDEGENISLGEAITYSLGSAVLLPFAGSGVGALAAKSLDYSTKEGVIAGVCVGGFIALCAATELFRKYWRGRRG
jgi:hypothetical protein